MRIKIVLRGGLALALLGAGVSLALAHGDAVGVVRERMDAMTQMGKALKNLALLTKQETPNADDVAKAAHTIERHSGETLTSLFPNGSHGRPSEAEPDIWNDWDDFSRQANQLSDLASELVERAEDERITRDDLRTAFGEIIDSCNECHDTFRASGP